jgi:hypothetical protein
VPTGRGKLVIRDHRAGVPLPAPSAGSCEVLLVRGAGTGAAGLEYCTTKACPELSRRMVAMQVGEGATFAHGNTLTVEACSELVEGK